MPSELAWLGRIGSIKDCVQRINRLGWNISFGEKDKRWYVQSGDKVIFSGDSREDVDIFLYGMALAYSILPSEIVEELREEFNIDS